MPNAGLGEAQAGIKIEPQKRRRHHYFWQKVKKN